MSKPFVFVTRRIADEVIQSLEEYYEVEVYDSDEVPVPRDVLEEKASQADALLTMLTDSIDEALLDQAPNLKVIANLAVGYDNIDVSAAQDRGIVVTNTPDVLTDTTADLTFGLLLATARRIPEATQYIENNQWQAWSPYMLAGADVHHKTLGIIGMGSIGEAVAKRATGFDMTVLYHNRSRKEQAEEALGVKYCSFADVIEQSDFVVCMTPLTPETENMFNMNVFKRMKSSAIFINSSRGGVVNEADLYEALKSKEIYAAGLDVFKNEPIQADHPLLELDNVVALPHIGSSSYETRTEMMWLTAQNIIAVLSGNKAKTPVN
ncbi:2-hydroxyacid dehydrogenase [Alkalibacillus almallahensis]|uniref:2-hydroxyacid dehydrogenase n=1 Tax=Alkalibacillus almallahensis TaxID=1379154 RepID=UPI001423B412|nr:D-glycerate dehydrogenase [Alkalibacillus almallahensis]NIK12180.1 glyoxylate reductase [Alkalibacillus almallahensis]